jgi:predicted MFS family arabinose efflux permease
VGLAAIRRREPQPAPRPGPSAGGGLLDGWRHILGHPVLRPLFLNNVLFNGLIMATEPLLSVLMLGQLRFAAWQYTLALAASSGLGGLLGSRLSKRAVDRYGRQRVLLAGGTLRACWPIGLAFTGPGTGGMLLVTVLQFALVTFIGITNPVFATIRLDRTERHLVARTLSAWTITGSATTAALTALWGLLAALTGPRTAIAAAGLLLLATPLLLPRQPATAVAALPNAAPEA